MKYKIAYLDESNQWLNTFYQSFKKDFAVELVKIDGKVEIDSLIVELFEKELDAIVTDYLLEEEGNVSFNGNLIVDTIRIRRPHFPLIMLTAHQSQAINHMDDVHIIYGKEILDGESDEELKLFKAKINSNIDHYYSKLANTRARVEELSEKKNSGALEMAEEDELTRLLILMDEFEPDGKDIPTNFMLPESITKLNEFVAETRAILEELKSQNKKGNGKIPE